MENPLSIEQEISDLEQQLAEKKAALESGSESAESLPDDKEILRDVVQQKIQQHAPQYQTPAKKQQDDDGESYNDPQLVDQVQGLINIAFSKSIDEAVKMAAASDNPALIDAFHDIIVDQLYDTLLERKKLEEVK